MSKQGELMLKGAGTGNESADQVGQLRRADFDPIDPATDRGQNIKARLLRRRVGGSGSRHGRIEDFAILRGWNQEGRVLLRGGVL